jgi:hypothetical protein
MSGNFLNKLLFIFRDTLKTLLQTLGFISEYSHVNFEVEFFLTNFIFYFFSIMVEKSYFLLSDLVSFLFRSEKK